MYFSNYDDYPDLATQGKNALKRRRESLSFALSRCGLPILLQKPILNVPHGQIPQTSHVLERLHTWEKHREDNIWVALQ